MRTNEAAPEGGPERNIISPKAPPAVKGTTDLRRRVAAILDSVPTAEEVGRPAELNELDRIRAATHAVLEDAALPTRDRVDLLCAVLRAAKKARLPAWAAGVVLSEMAHDRDYVPRPEVPAAASSARRLRHLGFKSCPICAVEVLSERECKGYEEAIRGWDRAEGDHMQALARAL